MDFAQPLPEVIVMPEAVAAVVLKLIAGHLLAGLLFALVFLVYGIGRIDPQARGASLGFRLLVLPGVVLLWPLLAWRWLRGAREPSADYSAHDRASRRST
jgi:hypothetical protein